ncbi:MAG: hypothetical protein H6845_02175 [Alphaproteobacteria bacterium]|nr:MAG: hypothetical protein H6845_02175 [Alphaproteobacteria bacterium]
MLINKRQIRFSKVQLVYQFLQLRDADLILKDLCNIVDDEAHIDEVAYGFKSIIEKFSWLESKFEFLLDGKWKWEYVNLLVKAIMIAGAFDILHAKSESRKKIIQDYVAIARIFGEDDSTPFIHANLDKLTE